MHRTKLLPLLALVAACSDAAAPTRVTSPLVSEPSANKQSTTSSRMLLHTDDGQSIQISSMDDDGGRRTQVTWGPGNSFDPSWAPDGKRVVFASDRLGGTFVTSIYSMNADGSAVTRITYPPAGHADWRPTKVGKQIAFHRQNSTGRREVHLVNLDGTGLSLVAEGSNPTGHPRGTHIAYESGGDIHVRELASGVTVNLTNSPDYDTDPSFSPSGKQIAYSTTGTGTNGINVVNMDGTGTRAATSAQVGLHYTPRWSPDGRRLVFMTNRETLDFELYTVFLDGSGATNITRSPGWQEAVTGWAR